VFPPDELTSKLISRDREMVRLRNHPPFYLCEGVDIGDYKMRIRIRRAASPDVRPLPRSADASPFSVVDRAAALRPLAVIVRADHDRRLLAAAAVFLQKARRIADSFEIAMATQRGQIARPRHSGPP
jgi:hypothetical protein